MKNNKFGFVGFAFRRLIAGKLGDGFTVSGDFAASGDFAVSGVSEGAKTAAVCARAFNNITPPPSPPLINLN